MKNKAELLSKLSAVLKCYIIQFESSSLFKDDHKIDLNILEQSLLDNDRELMYIIRPAGTHLLRTDVHFLPKYYLSCRGNHKEFIYIHIDLCTGEHKEIDWKEAEAVIFKPINPPSEIGFTKYDYLDKVIVDLKNRGFDEFLKSRNLEDLRRFAIDDERPTLVRYIDNINKVMQQPTSRH